MEEHWFKVILLVVAIGLIFLSMFTQPITIFLSVYHILMFSGVIYALIELYKETK